MEMDYTQFNLNNLFDLVANPGFSSATKSVSFTSKIQKRKNKIEKLLKEYATTILSLS